MTRHILMIVSNPAISTTMGWPVGFQGGCNIIIAMSLRFIRYAYIH